MLLYPLRVYPDFLRLLVPPGDFPRFPRNALVPQRMEGSSPPPHSLRHARSPTLTLITRDGGGGSPACPRLLHRRLVPLLRIPAALFPDVWGSPFPVPTARAEPHPHSTPSLNFARSRSFLDVWWAPLLHSYVPWWCRWTSPAPVFLSRRMLGAPPPFLCLHGTRGAPRSHPSPVMMVAGASPAIAFP
jgi:hypothetical protein